MLFLLGWFDNLFHVDFVFAAFNIPHLEKKPTETAHWPGKGTLFRVSES